MTIGPNDLMETCRTCRGGGLVEAGWNPVHGEPGIMPCGECEGFGYILTDSGRTLIRFLERLDPDVIGRRVVRGEGGIER